MLKFCPHGNCYWIPVLPFPFPQSGPPLPPPRPPEPPPGPWLIRDLMLVSTINEAAKQIADPATRRVFEHSVAESIKTLQAVAGKDSPISLEPAPALR